MSNFFFLMIRRPLRSTLFPYTPLFFFFFNDTATTEIYTLSLHDALPIYLLGEFADRPIADAAHDREREQDRRHGGAELFFCQPNGVVIDREEHAAHGADHGQRVLRD